MSNNPESIEPGFTKHRGSERSFFARAPLGCDVFRGRERDVRDESASVCLSGAGRQCIEAVLALATDEVRVDVRAPSRSAMFRYGQHVSTVGRVFTRHNPLVSKSGRLSRVISPFSVAMGVRDHSRVQAYTE